MAFWAAFFPLETGAVEFFHLELLRVVDPVEAAHVKHHHLLAAGPFAIGVGLDAASLAKRVMNGVLVELIVCQFVLASEKIEVGLRNGR
jgi:hypothetical protein